MTAITLHDLAVGREPIVIECSHCMRRVPLTAEITKARAGDMRTLENAGLHCARCGSRAFTVTRFQTPSKARSYLRNV